MIHGKSIRIKRSDDGHLIAASRSCTITTDCETIEVSAPGDGSWVKKIAGRKKWSINCSWLVDSDQSAVNSLLAVGNEYELDITYNGDFPEGEAWETLLRGKAICTKCNITAEVGSLVKGSFSFEGNGVLAPPNGVSVISDDGEAGACEVTEDAIG